MFTFEGKIVDITKVLNYDSWCFKHPTEVKSAITILAANIVRCELDIRWVLGVNTMNSSRIFKISTVILIFALNYSISAQNQTANKSSAHKNVRKSSNMKNKRSSRHRTGKIEIKPQTAKVDEAKPDEAKKAGTFNGDLRDLPSTRPPQVERPKREEPKNEPRVYVKDARIKPNE